MLTVETIGRIRREHFIKGKTIREIARDLKVSRGPQVRLPTRFYSSPPAGTRFPEHADPPRAVGPAVVWPPAEPENRLATGRGRRLHCAEWPSQPALSAG